MKLPLLIVDDDDEIRTQMRWALAQDYEVVLAANRSAAVDCFRSQRPKVVVLDLGLPPNPGTADEGLATLADLLAINPAAKVVIVSGQGEKEIAMRAVAAGAHDFLCKPVQLDELKLVLKRSYYLANLEHDYREMRRALPAESFEGLLGTSAAIQSVFDSIRKVSTADVPVLILGESGTGKEMTARAIHRRSARSGGPFVALNCSAIPENLLESELFGHEKGTFTGANTQRKGRIELAHGGTLFLDEIGEVSPAIQVKLLRFLQDQCIERVGGRQEIKVDARILAATNVDLKKAMVAGSFREDLFYRLAVVQLRLPPLREREGDIQYLAQAFLAHFASTSGRNGLVFAGDAIRALNQHAWPGNVRELQNRVRRAVVMSEGPRVRAEDLELTEGADGSVPLASLKEAREKLEREMIQQALRRHGGKIAPAASELGISRPTLYELMEKLALPKPGAS